MPIPEARDWEGTMLELWSELNRIADYVFPAGDDGRLLQVIKKPGNDILTSAEHSVDPRLSAFLARKFKCPVISEERPHVWPPEKERVWIIDPIDGTRNLSKRMPCFGIMGGYTELAVLKAGFIFLPFAYGTRREMYFAWENKGAWLADNKGYRGIRSASSAPLDESFVFIEGPSSRRLPETMRIEHAMPRTRQNISCAWSYALLAHAFPEETPVAGVISLGNKPWDNAAGVLIAKESGCVVSDRWGAPVTIVNCTDIVAANNKENHRQLLALVNGP